MYDASEISSKIYRLRASILPAHTYMRYDILRAISQGLIFVATFASAFNVKLLSTEGKKVAAEY